MKKKKKKRRHTANAIANQKEPAATAARMDNIRLHTPLPYGHQLAVVVEFERGRTTCTE